MALANVISQQSGTNFVINVEAAQLSDKVTDKDFTVLHNGTAVSNVNYNKTTQNTLTYVGASLPATTIEIRRKTSFDQDENLVTYANRFSSAKWNEALLKIQRWEEEVDLNGAGSVGAGVIPIPANDPYGSIWTNDTIYPPTRKAVYDKIETLAAKFSPAFSGVPTAPTAGHANTSTQIATTSHVKNVLGNAPAITNPTVSNGLFTSPALNTVVISDGTANSLDITASNISTSTFVTPTITDGGSVTGTFTVPTILGVENTNRVLSHADALAALNTKAPLASPIFTGTPTAPTPAAASNTTHLSTTAWTRSNLLSTLAAATPNTSNLNFKIPPNIFIQAGTSVVTTNASGDFTITYPAVFSTHVLTIAVNGDFSATKSSVVVGSTGTTSGFNGSTSSAVVSGSLRVNWVAFGTY